ncbi:MAG: DUF1580 domain-containing protein [Gemmataceae bacterium]
MAIETKLEELLSLADAARLLPARRRGKRPHISCLYRWTTTGCRGVVLESVMVGGTRCTSREALARFISRLSGQDDSVDGDRSASVPTARLEQRLDEERITAV